MTSDVRSLAGLAASGEHLASLRDVARKVMTGEWDTAATRSLLEDDGAWASELWAEQVRLGWPDLAVDARRGGGGGSVAELCAIAEVVGESSAPTPLAPAAVAAWVADAPLGAAVAVVGAAPPVTARTEGERVRLDGSIGVVPFGAVADRIVVLAEAAGEAMLVGVDVGSPGVVRSAVRPLDGSPDAAVELAAVDAGPEHVILAGDRAAERWAAARAMLTLVTAAELMGVATESHRMAVDYAKDRIAFGRPIGAFQAIKHRLVDQRSDLEVARALVSRAALAVDAGSPEASALVALAGFWAGTRLRPVCEGALHVFGGIGYTWDHDAHLLLRRAAVLTSRLGPRADHRAAVGRWLEGRAGRPPDDATTNRGAS